MSKESKFQSQVIAELRDRFEGCIILKNDPNHLQGFPDLLILYKDRWAALEVKKSETAYRGPNQEYWVKHADRMSYGSFICPENKERVFDELQQAFRPNR